MKSLLKLLENFTTVKYATAQSKRANSFQKFKTIPVWLLFFHWSVLSLQWFVSVLFIVSSFSSVHFDKKHVPFNVSQLHFSSFWILQLSLEGSTLFLALPFFIHLSSALSLFAIIHLFGEHKKPVLVPSLCTTTSRFQLGLLLLKRFYQRIQALYSNWFCLRFIICSILYHDTIFVNCTFSMVGVASKFFNIKFLL